MSAPVVQTVSDSKEKSGFKIIRNFSKEWPLHIMLLPAFVITLIFSYGPMYGLLIAFQDFNPALPFARSPWVGLDNFRWVFDQPAFVRTIYNTLFISIFKILGGIFASVVFSLLLNELRSVFFKRFFQTIVYIPHFISWVIFAGILRTLLASNGIVNDLITTLGFEPVLFLTSPSTFPWTMIWTDIWKGFGFGTVVYLAAITSIDPELYESAVLDGAGRFKQALLITLPMLGPIIVLMLTLALGNVFAAGFDQIFNLYHPVVFSTGDIIDTYIFRLGMQQGAFEIGAAVGLFRSVVQMALMTVSLYIAWKLAGYKIF